MTSYPTCVRELYESEVLGEAIFLELLKVARSDRDRYHFETLLQLETETKARLRPLLSKHGVSVIEDMDLGDVKGIVAAYTGNSWQDFAGGLVPVVQTFLARFREIESTGSPEDRPILQSMIQHESAILGWLTMEAKAPSETSLDDVIAQLQYPIDKQRRLKRETSGMEIVK